MNLDHTIFPSCFRLSLFSVGCTWHYYVLSYYYQGISLAHDEVDEGRHVADVGLAVLIDVAVRTDV